MGRLNYDRHDVDRLRQSLRSHGFGGLANAIDGASLELLRQEAALRCDEATAAEESGALRYRARILPLGPAARELLSCEATRALFAEVLGQPVTLSESRSCVTVYGEGDYIGPHLDQPEDECAFTLLAYLATTGAGQAAPDTGLVLKVYGAEPVAGTPPCIAIPTRDGSVIIGRGAEVWHERPPLLPGERVVALTACYAKAVEPSPGA